jgi:hypothetical protein
VGNHVQEILQRRGGEKRQDLFLKRGFTFLLLFLTYLSLLLEFPATRRGLWILLIIATVSFCSFLHLIRKEKEFAVEFLFSISLLITGASQAFAMPWLRMVYFPLIVCIAAFYRLKTVVSLLILIPFLELVHMKNEPNFIEEIIFLFALALTSGLSLFFIGRMKRKPDRKSVV